MGSHDIEIPLTIPRRRAFRRVIQLKITLVGTDPSIWRRIIVPESFTFYDLHVAIQNAMGWTDSHLHMFEKRRPGARKASLEIQCPFAIPEEDPDVWPFTTEVAIREFLRKKADRIGYRYDFGDDWLHEIYVEGAMPREKGVSYPVIIGGELACPPEDCGGLGGYMDCIKALRERDDSEGLLKWLGDWKPDRFDPSAVVFESPRKRLLDCLKD